MESKSFSPIVFIEYLLYGIVAYLFGYYILYPVLYPILFPESTRSSRGCRKISVSTPVSSVAREVVDRKYENEEKISPKIKTCIALGICDEEHAGIHISDNSVRKWKVQIMNNANNIFSKKNTSEKKKSSKKKR